ncbi:MAG: cobaltochelatase subunit CobN [Methanolobus sp.]|nr:cobaltochelatase subunit CobN [Methanolobus sp.]
MQYKYITTLILTLLLVLSITNIVSADEQKMNITYIGYSESEAIKKASQTNAYSDRIAYTFIPYYDSGISRELIDAAESGFFETQNVIFCQQFYDTVTDNVTVNESLKAAYSKGSDLYSIDPMSPTYVAPSYFQYHSNGTTNDPIANYYSNMGTEGEGLENAEKLLIYLTMNTRIAYIGFEEEKAINMASQTNAYNDLIEYTFIPYYDAGISKKLIDASETGFLEKQDVIFCQGFYDSITEDTTVNASLKAAHNRGAILYSIDPMGPYVPPSYFDYYSGGLTDDLLDAYYNGMSTEGKGLENAENLLLHLAKSAPTLLKYAISSGASEVNASDFVFVLGTDFNTDALNNVSNDEDISANLNITIFTPENPVPASFDFSQYGLIFIESQDEATVNGWTSSIKSAKTGGGMVIGYNLSENTTLANVDLYKDKYTDIERYWIQGGEANMANMIRFMGNMSSGSWVNASIDVPEVLLPKTNLTYIINSDSSLAFMKLVLAERAVITDRFNVNVMSGGEFMNSTVDITNEDVIILYMVGPNDFPLMKDKLLEANNNGAEIGMFGMLPDAYGITTFDMDSGLMPDYLYNDGYDNMENWIRCAGAKLVNVYIEYAAPEEPDIPEDGIYHPDAFPQVFKDSTEYLEWYADHGYDPSAPTIGIIANKFGQTPIEFTTEDAVLRELESKGCNVILTTYTVCTDDVDYITKDGEVLVDAIISLKGFYLNYDDHEKGIEYLKQYNVPVLKGITDYYLSPGQYLANVQGLSSMSIPTQVTQPEIDGLTDYIWLSGRVQDDETGQYYYKTLDHQVQWICERAIAWAELSELENSDKKLTIIYYNHEGGKNNIGASYIDIGSSFTLLLEAMEEEGYDLGNTTIPNGSEFIDLFIESRNVGTWAPGELEKVIESGYVTMLPAEEYLEWYNTLPQSVRTEVEETWGEVPGEVMTYENETAEYFVIPTIQLGNINFVPQPTRAGLSDESLIYHNESIPPTHQYLATYFWINNVYDADAMIHFGTHGTQEWLPGNEVGLWRYDYPSIMVAETPVVYPYIMDNVGEGTQAKRRGNAVIIDHMTPPIVEAGLYGDLATMHDKIHNYVEAKDDGDTAMMALYRDSTVQLYNNLSIGDDLGVSTEELSFMTDDDFESFVDTVLHNYLHELQTELMPYGLHIFGVPPEDEKLVRMVKSMLGGDFTDHIYDVLPKTNGTEEEWNDQANTYAMSLLNETLLNATDVSSAQIKVLDLINESITTDLQTAIEYGDNLALTTLEIEHTLRALSSEYIDPGTGNDPIRNPGALPTGKNFYSFDQRTIPDEETEAMGRATINTWLESYYTENDEYPNKVSFVMWSVETMRHEGLMEAQIYELLGVEIIRSSGRITGFEVIPEEDMKHPRIDVLLIPSGLYRDTFPYQLQLMDTAVRTVADLNETNETNYVRMNSMAIENAMLESGYNESVAQYISMSRIYSEAPGTYGTGVTEAVEASDTWNNSSKIADLFISRMSNIYGVDTWGENYEDVFKLNLAEVDVAIHSDTSNLYGIMDNDDYYQYLGGLGLAVRTLSGEDPSMFIADFKNVHKPEIITLREAFGKELTARYLNPNWMSGMMEFDYAGAREMMKAVEYMWGWEATTPDLVTDSDWDKMYGTYVMDNNDLGMKEFFRENPYQYQSLTARMIETIRKDSWDASDEVLQNLVKEYVESVVESGVTCCHHTCGNPLLDSYVQNAMITTGVIDTQTRAEYQKLMQEATHVQSSATEPQETSSSSKSRSSSPTGTDLKIVEPGSGTSNQTMMSDSGAGLDTDTPVLDSQKSTPDNYVEGYEMTKESITDPESGSGFSGSDIIASVLVLAAVGAIYVGFWKRRKF